MHKPGHGIIKKTVAEADQSAQTWTWYYKGKKQEQRQFFKGQHVQLRGRCDTLRPAFNATLLQWTRRHHILSFSMPLTPTCQNCYIGTAN